MSDARTSNAEAGHADHALRCAESVSPGAWAFVAVCFVFSLGISAAMFRFTAEDAFIIARYAENLVRGEGLVFNAGERINALTCPLMAIVEAGIYALTGSTIVATKLLSIVVVAAAHVACLWRLRGREESVWLYAALALASPFLAFWAIGGMETPILLGLITAVALLSLRITDKGIAPVSAAVVSLVAALCFLARYDSILFCGPVLLASIVQKPRKAAWLLGPAVLVAGGWLVFAEFYYHDIWPTSFYIKEPVWRRWEVKRTAGYLVQFLVYSGWGLFAVWTIARLVRGGRASRQAALAHLRRYWGLYLGLGCFACYALMNATKHMMFSYRMIVPFVPAAAVVLLDLHARVRPDATRPGGRRLLATACVGLLAVQGILAWQIDRVSINPGIAGDEYLHWSRRSYVEGFSRALQDAATAIRRDWHERGHAGRRPKISTFAAGITPYYLPEAYVYEQLVSYRDGGVDLNRAMAAADYQIVYTEPGAVPKSPDLAVVARYPFWFNGKWVDLCVLFNRQPKPYPLLPLVDGTID